MQSNEAISPSTFPPDNVPPTEQQQRHRSPTFWRGPGHEQPSNSAEAVAVSSCCANFQSTICRKPPSWTGSCPSRMSHNKPFYPCQKAPSSHRIRRTSRSNRAEYEEIWSGLPCGRRSSIMCSLMWLWRWDFELVEISLPQRAAKSVIFFLLVELNSRQYSTCSINQSINRRWIFC